MPLAAFIEAFQARYQAFYLRRQLMGPWCGGKPPGRTHEQGVAELITQFAELVAECGLAKRHALGGECGAALLVKHMEQIEQVQVLVGDIHIPNGSHDHFRIIES